MLEFIELVKNLSWPVVILGVATLFRVELKESFGRIVSLRYRNIELNFGAGLLAAKAIVTAAEASPPASATASATTPSTVLHELDAGPSAAMAVVSVDVDEAARIGRLAEVSPRAAIAESWHEVEVAAAEVARSLGLPYPVEGLKGLVEKGVLPSPVRDLADCLRAMRDRIKGEGPMLDAYLAPDQALHFADLSRSLAAHLNAFARASR